MNECEGNQRGRGGYLPVATTDSSTAPSIGAMSAFIDFVKPFSMLLPMCLQDSKSRSIPGGGLWGEIRQKHPTCSGRKTALTDPETTFQLSALLPALHTTHTHTHLPAQGTDGDDTVGAIVFTDKSKKCNLRLTG